MENVQIQMEDVINKLKKRLSSDAYNIAILEATIDVYKLEVERLNNELSELRKNK